MQLPTPLAAADNAIVDKSIVKEYLKLSTDDSSQDDFLQRWINSVSSAIEHFVRGPIVVRSFTEIYDGTGSAKLMVRQRPIVSLKTDQHDLKYRIDIDSPWQELEPNANHIIIKPDAPWYIYLYLNYFPAGIQNIQVAYNAGRPVTGPFDEIVVEAVTEIFKESMRGVGRLGQQSRTTSAAGVNATDSFYQLSQKHKSMLAPYVWYMP